MKLKEAIEFVGKNKHKPAIFVRKMDSVTFAECRELINEGKIDNEGNRDEDLDTKMKYYGKVHHLIRFTSGISEKGQLLISILKDSTSPTGYIRDNGTMFSLTFGKYYDKKVLTGNDWLSMCEDIVDNYDINNEGDKYVINFISNFFNSKKEEQLAFEYSLEEVINSSKELKEFYDNSQIGYVVSLHTIRQFEKDMMNCNRQPHPWIAYNYYMTPLKRTEEYKTHYCGDKLLEYFTDKEGTDIFTRGRLMYGHQGYAERSKVAKMIPILQAYIGSHYCETVEDFNYFNEMVVKFENGSDDGDETEYWRGMFKRVIREAGYTTIVNWYENQYKPVFKSEDWNIITTTINKMVSDKDKLNGSNIPTALNDLHIKKYHTGILMLTYVLYFKRKNKKLGLSRLTNQIVSEYVRLLNGDVKYENKNEGITESLPVWTYFGTRSGTIKSASVTHRWKQLFKYVFQNVESDIQNRSNDRDRQAEYRKNVLDRTSNFFENEGMNARFHLFPLSTDVLCVVNFGNGDGLHWLHKNPHSKGGDAKDGFLGMIDDNLDSSTKFKNWDCTPNEYWLMVAERNEAMVDTLTGHQRKLVESSINSIYQLMEIDLAA
jgi:hypothetical protein